MRQSKKHIQILLTAKAIFWNKGIHKASVEEICAEANVSKMTFYKYFRNKKELAKGVMSMVMDEALINYVSIMEEDISFHKKLSKTIQLKYEASKEISAAFLKDAYHPDDIFELGPLMKEYQTKTLDILISDIKKAQAQGEIRPNINTDFIIYILNVIQEKVNDEALQKLYSSTHEMIMDLSYFFFYGISNQERE